MVTHRWGKFDHGKWVFAVRYVRLTSECEETRGIFMAVGSIIHYNSLGDQDIIINIRINTQTCTYLSCRLHKPASLCWVDITDLRSGMSSKLSYPVDWIMWVGTQNICRFVCEGIGFANKLQGSGGIAGEYDGVFWRSLEEGKYGGACFVCASWREFGATQSQWETMKNIPITKCITYYWQSVYSRECCY